MYLVPSYNRDLTAIALLFGSCIPLKYLQRMMTKRKQRKPIIFGNYKEVLQATIMFYFAANLVFGEKEAESEFCETGWSEFVEDRKHWERECLRKDTTNMSACCKETAKYLEERYANYIKLCHIAGKTYNSRYF